jgi:hypothetical protein
VGALPHGLAREETSCDARAAAALVAAVAELQPASLAQLGALRRYRVSDHLVLDRSTRRHLELFQNLQDGGSEGTLFAAIDATRTPLGRRRLAAWLGEPLLAPSRSPPGTTGSRPGSSPTAAARGCARRCAGSATSSAPPAVRCSRPAARASWRSCAPVWAASSGSRR